MGWIFTSKLAKQLLLLGHQDEMDTREKESDISKYITAVNEATGQVKKWLSTLNQLSSGYETVRCKAKELKKKVSEFKEEAEGIKIAQEEADER
ncbi:hypothetical protein RHMOL_Rhmol03G0080600 [Rhododendron molle]|uniref:Uncharacterized protein n=1 Tax=Rhododendron molle TaxID=49168 RepID=A0ACC0PBK0_RHOML|nr:hypothetical protein RHMOL_Rhmol03G0080600 [Rhododendron molle]